MENFWKIFLILSACGPILFLKMPQVPSRNNRVATFLESPRKSWNLLFVLESPGINFFINSVYYRNLAFLFC